AALVIGVLVTLVGLLVFVTQCGPSRVFEAEQDLSAPATSTTSKTPTPPPLPPPPAPAGSAVQDGPMEFQVRDISRAQTVGDPSGNPYLTSKADGEFLVFTLSVRNTGHSPINYFGQNQNLIDTTGRMYSAANDADMFMSASDGNPMGAINPDDSIKVKLAFDVPPGTAPSILSLHFTGHSEGVQVRVD
ncbi:MAG TPA: DUF4352 domain-containing protein, partial [Mycobacterium sp.]|nr:DUF4352 domain-containing protein [Mycobacterium sp.]